MTLRLMFSPLNRLKEEINRAKKKGKDKVKVKVKVRTREMLVKDQERNLNKDLTRRVSLLKNNQVNRTLMLLKSLSNNRFLQLRICILER